MFFIIGIVLVIGCVFGGYSVHGDMRILWQPIEYVIILGGALGAFVAHLAPSSQVIQSPLFLAHSSPLERWSKVPSTRKMPTLNC